MQEAVGMPIEESEANEAELPMFEFDGERYEVVDAHLHTGLSSHNTKWNVFFSESNPALRPTVFSCNYPQVLDPYNEYQD